MRIESLSVLTTDPSGKAYLQEQYGKVIEGVMVDTASQRYKNKDLSGSPTAGTVEARRYVNATVKEYGTARAAGKGENIKADPVTIAIDTNRELLAEVEEKDISLMGVEGLVEREIAKQKQALEIELETKFFEVANTSATEVDVTGITAVNKIVDKLYLKLHTLKNKYVNGVPLNDIIIFANPTKYAELREYLDDKPSSNISTDEPDIKIFHGAKVESNIYMPDGVDFIVMADGSIAQPVLTKMADSGKIPLSDAYSFGMFFYYGTKAVSADLIFKISTPTTQKAKA